MSFPRPSLRVLFIPDKFKGTLTATAAASAMAAGWRKARPQDQQRRLPLTDGGDGFGDCLRRLLKARRRSVSTVDAAHRPCRAAWWITPSNDLAILESAQCIGLAMLPRNQYHPFQLDTRGLAPLLQRIAHTGVRRCLVGIGGSATNDAGFGLARSLGWKFLTRSRRPIDRWTELIDLHTVEPPPSPPASLQATQWIVATDVQNPLLGHRGATRVYGPQKGLRPNDLAHAERCLQRMNSVLARTSAHNTAVQPGAGAAGGLGFGLVRFVGAQLRSGFDLYAQYANLERHLEWADLIVTGEGAMDASTLMGKGVGEIARRCASRRKPCLGLAGVARDTAILQRHFRILRTLAPGFVSVSEALDRPSYWLRNLSAALATSYPHAR